MADPLAMVRGPAGYGVPSIKGTIAARMGEALGTVGGGDPITLDEDINSVTATIARRTDCFFYGGTSGPGAYGIEILDSTPDYQSCPIYKPVSVVASDQAGNRWPLTLRTEREFDAYTQDYHLATAQGTLSSVMSNPLYYTIKGENSFAVWPVPNYTSVIFSYTDLVIQTDGTITSAARPLTSADIGNAVTVTGGAGFTQARFIILKVDATTGHATVAGTIGTPSSTGGIAVYGSGGIAISGYGVPPAWPNPTDYCPLQPKNHMTVVYGTLVMRCELGLMSRDSETRSICAAALNRFESVYDRMVGDIEAEASTLSQHSEPGLRSLY